MDLNFSLQICIRYIIGADISHKNFQNENILFTRENDLNMLKFLVKSGVDIHVISADGKNALSNCSELEEVIFLFDCGIEIIYGNSYKNEEVKNHISEVFIQWQKQKLNSISGGENLLKKARI